MTTSRHSHTRGDGARSRRLVTASHARVGRRRLDGARARFTAAFEHAPVSMHLIDLAEAVTVDVNPAMCELTGYSRAELIGGDPAAILRDPRDRADARVRLVGLRAGMRGYRVERRFLDRDGKPIWLEALVSLMDDPAGPMAVVQAFDVTDRRRAEQALRELNEELDGRVAERTAEVQRVNLELEAANRELEAFIYSAAHDLRAPLRAIERFASTMRDGHAGPLTADALHYVDLVREGSHEMSALIDHLLSFSRVGIQAMQLELVDPAELVASALDELADQRAGRAVEVFVGPLAPVRADRRLLAQVFTNLLANALKFTRGREPAWIVVGCEAAADGPIYVVRDSGIGFDPADAEQIFNVFRRLPPAEAYEGSGVGLALVKRIVERHGGAIWAEGRQGRGATFRFRLPAGAGDPTAVGYGAPGMARP
jgi:PAS domain S-box-containing protein